MTLDELKNEDRLALAEAYRVYEILDDVDKQKVPSDFVQALLIYADLSLVPQLDPSKGLKEQNLSKRGLYLVMYMCTFE